MSVRIAIRFRKKMKICYKRNVAGQSELNFPHEEDDYNTAHNAKPSTSE